MGCHRQVVKTKAPDHGGVGSIEVARLSSVRNAAVTFVAIWAMFVVALMPSVFAADVSLIKPGDPFVSRPLGPFALSSNPASVWDVQSTALWGTMDQGRVGERMSKRLSYVEPEPGRGTGVLYWQQTDKESGGGRRELGYTLARPLGRQMQYGLNVKHIHDGGIGVFAADLGFIADVTERWRWGLVASNIIGETVANPTHMAFGVSYTPTSVVAVSFAMNAPSLVDQEQMEIGIAMDVSWTKMGMRVGRIVDAKMAEWVWMGTFFFNLHPADVHATFRIGPGDNRRMALGIKYPF